MKTSFRFHLSTMLVAGLGASGVLWLNMSPYEIHYSGTGPDIQGMGVPSTYYRTYPCSEIPYYEIDVVALGMDFFAWSLALVILATVWERIIRRKAALVQRPQQGKDTRLESAPECGKAVPRRGRSRSGETG